MGLEQGGNMIYLQTYEGEIKREVSKDTEGAAVRVNKEGKTVYELFYRALSGVLKRVWVNEGKYGKELIIMIEDEEKLYSLQLSLNSRYAEGFLRRVEDIDLTKRIRIVVGTRDENNYLVVYQKKGDKQEMIPARYTKDDPGECPPFELITVNNEEVWDRSKRINFYSNILVNKIAPELESLHPEISVQKRSEEQTEETTEIDNTLLDEELPESDIKPQEIKTEIKKDTFVDTKEKDDMPF